jgi:ABC-type sulfate transport system permease component
MHRKGVFALAGVFLAVAIVVPFVVFALQAADDLIIIRNPAGMRTNGNVSTVTPEQVQQSHTNTLIIVAVIEVVFVLLFVVTMYYGIKHVHPYH